MCVRSLRSEGQIANRTWGPRCHPPHLSSWGQCFLPLVPYGRLLPPPPSVRVWARPPSPEQFRDGRGSAPPRGWPGWCWCLVRSLSCFPRAPSPPRGSAPSPGVGPAGRRRDGDAAGGAELGASGGRLRGHGNVPLLLLQRSGSAFHSHQGRSSPQGPRPVGGFTPIRDPAPWGASL